MKRIFTTLALLAAVMGATVSAFAGISPDLLTTSDPTRTILAGTDGASLSLLAFAGIIINQASLNDLFTGFKAAFNQGFRDATTYWERIATVVPSTGRQEHYAWLGQWPGLRKWVGDRVIKSLESHDYSIKNESFESTVSVIKDDLDDDAFGVYQPMFQEQGHAAKTHPDELIFNLLANGFSTLCYDDQNYFDTDHPVGNEESGISSVSNMQAGGGNPWFLLDTRRALKPLIFQRRQDYNFQAMTSGDDESVFMRKEFRYGVDARVNVGFGFWQTAFGSKDTLDPTNYQAAMEAMMAFKSDEGRPLGIMPNILVCGPSNRAAALSVIEKLLVNQGESNINYKSVEVVVVPWLT